MSHRGRPGSDEYGPFYAKYVDAVPEGMDLLDCLSEAPAALRAILSGVGPEKERYRYAESKWSIREVLGHIVDTERVMSTRALAFARGQTTPLFGMEQDDWARESGAHERPLGDLLDEFEALRRANVRMLAGLPEEAWDREGVASGVRFSVRALAWILAGHERHHRALLRRDYAAAGVSE